MENTCIKTVGWWIFKSKAVIHEWKIRAISKFMDSSDTYHVHRECEKCGATKTDRFVEENDLILAGYPVKELQKIDRFNWYYPNEKQY